MCYDKPQSHSPSLEAPFKTSDAQGRRYLRQEDLNERSQQVRMMSQIYSKARQVVVWERLLMAVICSSTLWKRLIPRSIWQTFTDITSKDRRR